MRVISKEEASDQLQAADKPPWEVPRVRKMWQHKYVHLDPRKMDLLCNGMLPEHHKATDGEGWELVSVVDYDPNGFLLSYKRLEI